MASAAVLARTGSQDAAWVTPAEDEMTRCAENSELWLGVFFTGEVRLRTPVSQEDGSIKRILAYCGDVLD